MCQKCDILRAVQTLRYNFLYQSIVSPMSTADQLRNADDGHKLDRQML